MKNSTVRWQSFKLGECLTLLNGRAYAQQELLDQGIPVIRIQNLNGGENWYYSDLALDYDKYCDSGDLLYAWSTTFGPYIWNGNRGIYHYHIWKVLPKDICDKKFAYYYLLKLTEEIKSHSHGVAMLHITKSKMEAWNFPLPPLPEQHRIVAKLDSLFVRIDRAIEIAQQNIFRTQQFMASVLDEVFDGLDCKRVRLDDLCDVIGGGTPKTNVNELWNGDIVWLSPTDLPPIGEIAYISDSAKRISKLGLEKSSAKMLPQGSVVYSSRASIGKIGVAETALCTNQGFTNFICHDNIHNLYLAFALKKYTPEIAGLSNSTTFAEVNKTNLRAFTIPVPDISEQVRISASLQQFERKAGEIIGQFTTRLKELNALKSSLLDAAFKGEL